VLESVALNSASAEPAKAACVFIVHFSTVDFSISPTHRVGAVLARTQVSARAQRILLAEAPEQEPELMTG
jgi:hypothetical protein